MIVFQNYSSPCFSTAHDRKKRYHKSLIDYPKALQFIVENQPSHECTTVTFLPPSPSRLHAIRWSALHTKRTNRNRLFQWVDFKMLEANEQMCRKRSYRFYKRKLGASLGQTISEWNTWSNDVDSALSFSLFLFLVQTWKHNKKANTNEIKWEK